MITADQKHILAVVASRRSLSAASRDLRITVTALRRALITIENSVGTPLFERATQGLAATAATLRLIAKPLSRDDLTGEGRNPRRLDSRRPIIIAASTQVPQQRLESLAVGLSQRVGLPVELAPADGDAADLSQADLAVLAGRPAMMHFGGACVGRRRHGLYVSRRQLAQFGQVRSASDLARLGVVARNGREFDRLGLTLPSEAIHRRVDTASQAFDAVRAGLGAAVLDIAQADCEIGLARLMPHLEAHDEIWLVRPGPTDREAVISTAFAYLSERLGERLAAPLNDLGQARTYPAQAA